MKTFEEIRKDQIEYGQEKIDVDSIKKKKKNIRITPQMSLTLDKKSIEFLKDMALFYGHKKRRLYTYSQTMRVFISYCKEMEHELQGYI